MRRHLLAALQTIVIVAIGVSIVSLSIEALAPYQGGAGSYTVLASVEPARYIVVDSNLQIKQIISNTGEDVVPYVTLNTLDGPQLPYTSSVRAQFLSLKHTVSFSRSGIVYTRRTSGSLKGAIQSVGDALRKFIFGQ